MHVLIPPYRRLAGQLGHIIPLRFGPGNRGNGI